MKFSHANSVLLPGLHFSLHACCVRARNNRRVMDYDDGSAHGNDFFTKILQNAFLERVFNVKECFKLVCLKNHFKKEILQTLVQIISFLNNEKLGNFINLTKFVERPKCFNAKIFPRPL